MKLVFFGSSHYVIPILEVLRTRFDLVLVVTTERDETEPVRSYCNKHKLHYYVVADFRDKKVIDAVKETNAPLAVLAYFGLILPKEVLELFPMGILNLHPSLLPKYRGPTPGQTALLNGDEKTGVTLIKLDEQVDHGPILTQVEEPIRPDDTSDTLYERLFMIGSQLLDKYIDKYLQGQALQTEQDHKKATPTKHLTRQDGYIDSMHPPPPKQLDRMIRAYTPWPGVWTKMKIRNQELRIMLLPAKKVQVEGGKPMTYKDFLNGYPEAKMVLLTFAFLS